MYTTPTQTLKDTIEDFVNQQVEAERLVENLSQDAEEAKDTVDAISEDLTNLTYTLSDNSSTIQYILSDLNEALDQITTLRESMEVLLDKLIEDEKESKLRTSRKELL